MQQYELEIRYLGQDQVELKEPKDVYHAMRDLKGWDKEVLAVFCLDTKNRIVSREIVSVGTLNSSIMHPRDIFRKAIARNCNAIIISHNHPSGNVEPSKEDDTVTKRINDAGDLLHIHLLDHVIVGRDSFYSYSQNRRM